MRRQFAQHLLRNMESSVCGGHASSRLNLEDSACEKRQSGDGPQLPCERDTDSGSPSKRAKKKNKHHRSHSDKTTNSSKSLPQRHRGKNKHAERVRNKEKIRKLNKTVRKDNQTLEEIHQETTQTVCTNTGVQSLPVTQSSGCMLPNEEDHHANVSDTCSMGPLLQNTLVAEESEIYAPPEQLLESTDDGDINHNITEGATRSKKRGKKFKMEELEEIVQYVDNYKYAGAKRGEINKHKTNIMLHLTCHLNQKFGTKHTKLQVQKRYSDLQVRQGELLSTIRRKLKEDGKLLETTTPQSLAEQSCSLNSNTTAENLTAAVVEEDIVTLTLHPLLDCSENGSNLPTEGFATESRLVEEIKLLLQETYQEIAAMVASKLETHEAKVRNYIADYRREVKHLFLKKGSQN